MRNRNGSVEEDLGWLTFSDESEAVNHARRVIADLVRDGAREYAGWTLDVLENDRVIAAIKIV